MGWETRGTGRYYYRKRRVGKQVFSEYIGLGPLAETIAALDMIQKHNRNMERAGLTDGRRMVAADQEMRRSLDDAEELIRALTAGILVISGYHTHRQQWRRIRGQQ